jgi:hypothetical protein
MNLARKSTIILLKTKDKRWKINAKERMIIYYNSKTMFVLNTDFNSRQFDYICG